MVQNSFEFKEIRTAQAARIRALEEEQAALRWIFFLQCLCETVSQHLFESAVQAAVRRALAEAQAMQADPDHRVHMWIRVSRLRKLYSCRSSRIATESEAKKE